jgi:hypothetical protein
MLSILVEYLKFAKNFHSKIITKFTLLETVNNTYSLHYNLRMQLHKVHLR